MFDLPEPFKPVMALKKGSKPGTTVRVAYDLNPSKQTSLMCMAKRVRRSKRDKACSVEGGRESEENEKFEFE